MSNDSSSGAQDYLFDVEAIVGTEATDRFTVNDLPIGRELRLDGAGGNDKLAIFDVAHGSRTLFYDNVAVVTDAGVSRLFFSGMDRVILAGELNDTLVLTQSSGSREEHASRMYDLGDDGDFGDAEGARMRDLVDGSELVTGSVFDLRDPWDQTISQDGEIWFNLRGVNGALGSRYDDVFYAPDDGATIDDGAGGDLIVGGADGDRLVGGAGDDTIYGGGGDDWIVPGARTGDVYGGVDRAYGGAGDDVFFLKASGTTYVDGGAGDDRYVGELWSHELVFRPGDGHDRVQGGITGNLNSGGFAKITLAGIARTDIAVIWNPHPTGLPGEDGGELIEGEMAIVIGSSGDSIYFERVSGTRFAGGSIAVDLRSVFFGDGTERLGRLGSDDIVIASADPYATVPHLDPPPTLFG